MWTAVDGGGLIRLLGAAALCAAVACTAGSTGYAADYDDRAKLLEKQKILLKKQIALVKNGNHALVRRPVNLVDTGGRALGAVDARSLRSRSHGDVLVCTDTLGIGISDCRKLIGQGPRAKKRKDRQFNPSVPLARSAR